MLGKEGGSGSSSSKLKKESMRHLFSLCSPSFSPSFPPFITLLIPRLVAKFAGYNHDDVRALREEVDKRVFEARHGLK